MDAAIGEAMKQMEEKNYTALLQAKGCKPVLKYGIACHKKKCRVVMQKLL